jgi:hypothetical protein
MQRGLIITLKASVNSARERACGSVMPAKAVGGRTTKQHSERNRNETAASKVSQANACQRLIILHRVILPVVVPLSNRIVSV